MTGREADAVRSYVEQRKVARCRFTRAPSRLLTGARARWVVPELVDEVE
jgi:hypothetical protein